MRRSPFQNFIIVIILSIIFLYFYIAFEPHRLLPIIEPAIQEGMGLATASSTNMPLSQYMIKGAYNAAYDGTNMSIEQLQKVLSSGTRFIDLEIRSQKDLPIMAAVTKGNSVLPTSTILYLNDVLGAIMVSSFSNVPNNGDPLFINFRIVLDPETVPNKFYTNFATLVNNNLGLRLFSGKIDKSTPLKSLMGKIILCIDVSLTPDYKNYVECNTAECSHLPNLISAETRGDSWLTVDYEHVIGIPPTINDVNIGSIQLPMGLKPILNLVVPPLKVGDPYPKQKNPSPVDLYNYVDMNGMQLVLFMYYQKDTGNNEIMFYESIFANTSTAFVPMGFALNYIQQSYKTFQGAQTANYPASP